MWQRTHQKIFKGLQAADVWRVWTDVNRWAEWHGDLDFCTLEGPFEAGQTFTLKPAGGKPVQIRLTHVDPGHSFTDCTSFPGASMTDTHTLESLPEGVRMTNTVKVTGPLGWFWVFLVARHVARTVPEDMESMVRLIRSRRG